MKVRMGFVSNSSSSSFMIGLKTISKEEIYELFSKAEDNRTFIENQLPPVLVSEILSNKRWAEQEGNKEYAAQMVRALETVGGWYKQYPKVLEVDVARYDERIQEELLAWERAGLVDILYYLDDNGDERRTKLFE